MSRSSITGDHGVCLVEVLIAMAAGLVVLAATLQSLDHFERRLSKQHAAAARTQDLRIGLKVLADEVRAAGTASPPSEPPLAVTGRQAIEFDANLGGLVTALTAPVSSVQLELPVLNGSDWAKGKRVFVCDREGCAGGRLARDGQKALLSLAAPLEREFPAGSEVRVANRVRYYVKVDRKGPTRVMREVDGGANPLIGEIARFQFSYFTRAGAPTTDPLRAARVRVEAAVADAPLPVIQEIGLRGP
jgi:hypothetical protein